MLSCLIDEFFPMNRDCKNLSYAENSVKELLRYKNDFNKFLNEQCECMPSAQVNDLSQHEYIHVFNFITSQPASPITIKAHIWKKVVWFSAPS